MKATNIERSAFSLLEVLLALALLVVLLVPCVSLVRAAPVQLSSVDSAAASAFEALHARVLALSAEKVDALVEAAPAAEGGYHEIAPAPLFPQGAAAILDVVGKLEAKLYARVLPGVMGRFGLDRVDFAMVYRRAGEERWLTHAVVRRNLSQLLALGHARATHDLAAMGDSEFQELIETVGNESRATVTALEVPTSPFPVPVLPAPLARFRPPMQVVKPGLAEERLLIAGARRLVGHPVKNVAAKPRFALEESVCQ